MFPLLLLQLLGSALPAQIYELPKGTRPWSHATVREQRTGPGFERTGTWCLWPLGVSWTGHSNHQGCHGCSKSCPHFDATHDPPCHIIPHVVPVTVRTGTCSISFSLLR